MMQKLGNYVLAGRFQAVFVTSLLTLLGMVIPLFSYVFSGLVPAFVTLRLYAVAGMQVIIGSLLLVSVITVLVGMNPLVAVALAIGVWMPIWLCANVLRVTEDQGKCLVTAWGCSLVFIILMHLLVKDLDIWWTDWLKLWVEQVFDAEQRALVEDRLLKVAPLMTAMVAAGLFVKGISCAEITAGPDFAGRGCVCFAATGQGTARVTGPGHPGVVVISLFFPGSGDDTPHGRGEKNGQGLARRTLPPAAVVTAGHLVPGLSWYGGFCLDATPVREAK
ncbi:MAG: hypothetical protein P8X93_08550 [Gammaproteobacteria bacterium]